MIYKYYTDGAATMKKINGEYIRGAGGWAWARVDSETNKILEIASGHIDNTSNNAMELNAIYQALGHYITHYYSNKTYDTVKIYSDSAYCVNMLKVGGWVYSWSRNNWTRGKKHEPIENLDLIKEIYEILIKLREGFKEVEFVKVIGHSGNELNDYVDQLAVEEKEGIIRGKRIKQFFIDDFCCAPINDDGTFGPIIQMGAVPEHEYEIELEFKSQE